MLFSVLIPIFNAGKYIDKCIDSIINQTEKNIEIILVDDDSNDDSLKICQKWVRRYPDIVRLIEKNKTGSLLTRRRCLKESLGEYIYFMDADDYLVDNNALGKIKKVIEKTKCDLVFFNATSDPVTKKPLYSYNFYDGQIFEGNHRKELYNLILDTKSMNSLWNKVFHRALVDWDVDYEQYKKISVGTDFFQGFPIISKAQKIAFIDETFYFYRKTEGSIIHKFQPNLAYSLKEGHKRLIECTKYWDCDITDLNVRLANRYMLTTSTMVFKGRLINKHTDIVSYVMSIGEDSVFLENYSIADFRNINFFRKSLIELVARKRYKLIATFLPMFKRYGM